MKRISLVLLFAAACSPSGQQAAKAPDGKKPANPAPGPVQGGDKSLTGLFESGAGARPNQLCLLGHRGGSAGFGLVVWGEAMNSCSGTGTATLKDGKLQLAMAGDSECVIPAAFTGGAVMLPQQLPAGCAYYCGARARMGGVGFERRSSASADALKAKDLVGDSLCKGL